MNHKILNQQNMYYKIAGKLLLRPSNRNKSRREILIEVKKIYRDVRRKAITVYNKISSKNKWNLMDNPYLDDKQ